MPTLQRSTFIDCAKPVRSATTTNYAMQWNGDIIVSTLRETKVVSDTPRYAPYLCIGIGISLCSFLSV